MARNFDATALDHMMGGCAPACPPGPKSAISPIISVSSVNGESGDIVLRNLIIGDKEYNGSNEIRICAKDLGLGKAVVYIKAVSTTARVLEELADAEAGDLFFCNQDGLFYLSVGEGDSKAFVSDMKIKDYSKIIDTASKIALEVDEESFEMTAKLYDLNGKLVFESEPVLLPSGMKDVIKRGYFDPATNEIVFVLKNDTEIRVPLGGLIDNIQPKITETNKLPFRLVEGLPEMKVELEQAISAEIGDRTTAVANEAVLRNQADEAEILARTEADKAEKEARELADNGIKEDLIKEIQDRKDGDSALDVKIGAEERDRKVEDLRLSERIDANVSAISTLNTELINEKNLRSQADDDLLAALRNEINKRESEDNNIKNLLSAEETARTDSDNAILAELRNEEEVRKTLTDALRTDLTTETTERKSADATLSKAISDEIEERALAIQAEADTRIAKDAELAGQISSEASIREQADITLQGNIDTEAGVRAQADDDLLTALRAEITKRGEEDAAIRDEISLEQENREAADTYINGRIDNLPVYGMIKEETTKESAFAAIYHLTSKRPDQTEAEFVGAPIAIPKDFLVKKAELKTVTVPGVPYPEAQVGDKYIDFTINVKTDDPTVLEEHIYLPVKDLMDIYTEGDGISIAGKVISVKQDILNEIRDLRTDLGKETTKRTNADADLRYDLNNLSTNFEAHANNIDNPHHISKAQLELENVDNTSDINKPVSTATQQAIKAEEDARKLAVSTEETARKAAILAEENARKAAVLAEETARKAAISDEELARKNADAEITTEVNKNSRAILTEAEARATKDTDLQDQINAINARRTHAVGLITGDGSTTIFNVTHGLDTLDVIVQVYDSASGETVLVDSSRLDADTVKFTFKDAPAAGKVYRVLFYGMNDIVVVFNPNGGTGSMASLSATKNVPFTTPQCTLGAPEGKEFDMWAVNAPDGQKVAAGSKYTSSVDVTLFATWKTKVMTPNTFSGSVSSIPPITVEGLTGEYIEKATLLSDGMTKEVSMTVGNDGFITFAIDNILNISLDKVEEQVGPMSWQDITSDFITKVVGNYTFFYHKDITTGNPPAVYTYHISFK